MSAPFDVIAYAFNADLYCPDCITGMFSPPGGYIRLCSYETILDRAAAVLGIDRDDESSFDSGDFPKVVFADMIEPGDRCGACGELLAESDDETFDPGELTTTAAIALGTAYGRNAGSWAFDGNTSADTIRTVLAELEAGEFEIPAPLSGEWADGLTVNGVLSELLSNAGLSIDPDDLDDLIRDDLLSAFEEAYSDAYAAEVVRSGQAFLPDDARLDLFLALAHFTTDWHGGQFSRLYRLGCRAGRRLADEYGISHPLDIPLGGAARELYAHLEANYSHDCR